MPLASLPLTVYNTVRYSTVLIEHLNYFELLVIMSMLLIAGIKRNPGPLSDSFVSSSDSITSAEEQAIKDKFSVVHYNVQSILNKLDLIET